MNQPTIAISSEYDWIINRATFDKWNVSTGGEVLESPYFGPTCFASIKFRMQLTYSDDSNQYKLNLGLIECDDSTQLEIKYKKFTYSDKLEATLDNKDKTEYIKIGIDKQIRIWKSKFFFDLYDKFFKNIHFKFKCKFPYKATPELRSLTDDLNALRNDSKIVDFYFDVDEKEFPVNKSILSARSSFFKRMFENERFVENVTNRAKISDFEHDVIEGLFDFIYTAQVKNLDQIAPSLIKAAHMYDIKSLICLCEQSMMKSITADCAVLYLVLSHTYDLSDLKRKSINFINQNALKVTTGDDWQQHVSSNCELVKQLYLDLVDKHSSQ